MEKTGIVFFCVAAVALLLLAVSCTTAEVVASAAVGAVAVANELLASGKITPAQHAALVEALSGWSTETVVGLSVAATKALDLVVAGGKKLHKNRAAKRAAKVS